MKQLIRQSTVALIVAIGLGGVANAQTTLFEDTFSDGNTKDGWVERTAGATTYDYGTAGTATIVPAQAQPSSLWHNFTSTVLMQGWTLKLSFDVMMSRTTSQGSGIRFGLGYSSAPLADGANNPTPVDGYMSSAPFLGHDGDVLNYWMDGPINWGNAVTVGFPTGALDNNDNYSITNTVLRAVTYEISRSGFDVLSAVTSVNGGYSSRITYTTPIPDFRFNAAGLIAPYNSGETYTYDNVKVETVQQAAYELAEWTFDDTSSEASALGTTTVASGLTVSALSLNDSFDFAGLNNVPSSVHDGYGFGGNGGAAVIFLHRANYFDGSSVPTPRPTVDDYTSWSDAQTGGDLSVNGGAPLLFTVTADAGREITVNRLTFDRQTGDATIISFQEADAAGGAKVTLNADGDWDVALASPIVVESGKTKSFTFCLNSGFLNSGVAFDDITLYGSVTVVPLGTVVVIR